MKVEYDKLGLRVGLEIHQQLDTKHKLFCNCPTSLATQETPHDEIVRYLRVTKSEVGEIDPAAMYEVRKGRRIEYQVPHGHVCLVELDEEPPHELNIEALKLSVAIAIALHSRILDEVYVMRKIVVDGSNTTGFQRTAIVAMGGYIDDDDGRVSIQTICLEEDAARKVSEGPGYVRYNLDRLGIPLIEISTGPDIKSPQQAMRVAARIGLLMRLTGKVKRGIGTIRQDLNISIRGGEKIEVKGVSKLEIIPKVVEYEVIRQLKLLEIRSELLRRGIKASDMTNSIADVTEVVKDTKSRLISKSLRRGLRVYVLPLRGFKGVLKIEVQPGRRFGTELADYARAWGGVGGLIHSDELPGYGISSDEVEKIYEVLGLSRDRDAFVMVLADKERAKRALSAVAERARYALIGIPKETRGANPDGTTRYLRPQPGAARMYPETDVPPVRITAEVLNEALKYVPKSPEELLRELTSQHGLSNELAGELIRDPSIGTYLDLVKELGDVVQPRVIATTLMIHIKGLKADGVNVDLIGTDDIKEVLRFVGEGIVAKEAIPEILKEVVAYRERGVNVGVNEVVKKYSRISISELRDIIRMVISENRDVVLSRGSRAFKLIMGRVMATVRGRVDGGLVAKIVREELDKVLK